ncbi:MAG: DUF1624 domain-containing protein [Ruminococcus sp.]|jgi:uncharacterized membrane protein|nr:DUF1624 domain-containing protein [Ruminococcus sp.]
MSLKLPEAFDRQNRVFAIDALRGFAMVYIMLYHLFYDLFHFSNIRLAFFFTDWWEVLHIVFVSLLFIVSGISTHFSRNSLKRGVIVFFLGQLITLVTAVAVNITNNKNLLIVFGVLTFIGLSMMIYSLIRPGIEKLKIPWITLFIISIILFVVFLIYPPHSFISSNNNWLYPLGILGSGFFSADYFPLVPYFFIFLAGTALAAPIISKKFPQFFYRLRIKPLEFIGRHSLLFYIVHQPAIIVILFLLSGVI